MAKDLSKDPNSATSAFMRVLPLLNNLALLTMEETEKVELANNIIFNELKASWNSGNSVSKDYIARVMTAIKTKTNIDEIIKDITIRIEKGKNYNG